MKKRFIFFFCTFLVAILVVSGCRSAIDNDVNTVPSPAPETAEGETVSENGDMPGTTIVPSTPVPLVQAELVHPADLVYQGAFRLPDEYVTVWDDRVNFWSYSGMALAYYSDGDLSGADDGFPGSLFAVGHDQSQFVSEISIPAPAISRNVNDLPVANTLQSPADITSGMFGYLELPTQGLACLPSGDGREEPRLYFSWGQHFQGTEPSHGWCGIDLSNPSPAGPWHFGPFTNYVTNDYLFEIPKSWADRYAPGMTLASGRFREGVWGGFGPALFAWNPETDGNPPAPGATLNAITPLLLYGTQEPGQFEITTTAQTRMNGYSEPDAWSGGAWLTAGDKSAVIFVGTKAVGNYWYGFSNGVVWDYDCADRTPPDCPDVPDWPYSNRGYWADAIESRILFFDPTDLAAVATGQMQSWEPQPYASWCIDDYLYDPGYAYERGKRQNLGACAFDSNNGILYIVERMVADDEEKSIIHVWRITE